MLGTTLIHAPILGENPVAKIALFYDEDCFPTLDFRVLQTLDFPVLLIDASHSWSEGEPLFSMKQREWQFWESVPLR